MKVKPPEWDWSEVAQSCLTLCDPMDCSPPGFSVHRIFKARVLEWVAIAFSRGSSWLRDRTLVSRIVGRRFTLWATREAQNGISALIRRDKKNDLSTLWGHNKAAICEPEDDTHQELTPPAPWSGLPLPCENCEGTMRSKCPLLKSPSLWYSVLLWHSIIAAWAD